MKRFMLFGYDEYSQGGGLSDFIASFDTAKEAWAKAPHFKYDNYEVFDRIDGTRQQDADDEWCELEEDS